jgi:hypothetical protein
MSQDRRVDRPTARREHREDPRTDTRILQKFSANLDDGNATGTPDGGSGADTLALTSNDSASALIGAARMQKEMRAAHNLRNVVCISRL